MSLMRPTLMELSRIEKGIVGHKCEWCGKRHGSFLSATLCCLPLKEAPPQRKGFDRHVDGRFVPAHWAVHPEPDLEVEA